MSQIEVQNICGTSDDKITCPWEFYWETTKERKFQKCANCNCTSNNGQRGNAEHGAHVNIVGNKTKKFIVPLCQKCNNPSNTQSFYVEENDLCEIADKDIMVAEVAYLAIDKN